MDISLHYLNDEPRLWILQTSEGRIRDTKGTANRQPTTINYCTTYNYHHIIHTLSLSTLTAIFPDGPGLAGTRMSWCWILLELRMTEVVSGVNWSCKMCKAPVKLSSPTNQRPTFTGRMHFLSPNQQRQSTEGKLSHYNGLTLLAKV